MGAADERKGAIKSGVQFSGWELPLMEGPFNEKVDPRRKIPKVGGVDMRCCPLWAYWIHCTHGPCKR